MADKPTVVRGRSAQPKRKKPANNGTHTHGMRRAKTPTLMEALTQHRRKTKK